MRDLLPSTRLLLRRDLRAKYWSRRRLLHAAEVHPSQSVLNPSPARAEVERPVGKDVLQLERRFPRDVERSCEEIRVVGRRGAEGEIIVLQVDRREGELWCGGGSRSRRCVRSGRCRRCGRDDRRGEARRSWSRQSDGLCSVHASYLRLEALDDVGRVGQARLKALEERGHVDAVRRKKLAYTDQGRNCLGAHRSWRMRMKRSGVKACSVMGKRSL